MNSVEHNSPIWLRPAQAFPETVRNPRDELPSSGEGRRDDPLGRSFALGGDHSGVPIGYAEWKRRELESIRHQQGLALRAACQIVALGVAGATIAAIFAVLLAS